MRGRSAVENGADPAPSRIRFAKACSAGNKVLGEDKINSYNQIMAGGDDTILAYAAAVQARAVTDLLLV